MEIDVSYEDIDEYRVNGHGEIKLGAEYSNATVTLAIIEVEEPDYEPTQG